MMMMNLPWALRCALSIVLLGVVFYVAWKPLRQQQQRQQQQDDDNQKNHHHHRIRKEPPPPTAWTIRKDLTISTGELPGYTGWARPEFTLAGYFEVVAADPEKDEQSPLWSIPPADGHDSESFVSIVVACRGHVLCSIDGATTTTSGGSTFFVRAYGPAVVTGRAEWVDTRNKSPASIVVNASSGYRITLGPLVDAGLYTVEVVLSFSRPPSVHQFPLTLEPEQPYTTNYEGYLLPGFPRLLEVQRETKDAPTAVSHPQLPLCSMNDLTIRNATDGLRQGRWRVVDSVRQSTLRTTAHQGKDATTVALSRYQHSYNSLGIVMDYQFVNCRLLPLPTPTLPNPLEHCLGDPSPPQLQQQQEQEPTKKMIHIILIGDSVMRLQYQFFKKHYMSEEHQQPNSTIKLDFYELYGGYFLTQLVNGPKLRQVLFQDQQQQQIVSHRIILFNTGMHDIHRLCGNEFASERTTYLPAAMLQQPCSQLYRAAIQDFMNIVLPTTTTISERPQQQQQQKPLMSMARRTTILFQTTSAAWPKYGNWGVNWDPRYGQPLPLDSSFVQDFNEIAVDTVASHWKEYQRQQQQQPRQQNDENGPVLLYMVDSYWMSLARPDHREINKLHEIGKKLSHPGVEVVSAMVRVWTLVILRLLCG